MPRMPTISSCACRAWLPPATSRETPCNRQASADADSPFSTCRARLSAPIFYVRVAAEKSICECGTPSIALWATQDHKRLTTIRYLENVAESGAHQQFATKRPEMTH